MKPTLSSTRRSVVATCLGLLLAWPVPFLASCGGGGGGGQPQNPAPGVSGSLPIDFNGVWRCDFNELVETDTVDVYPFEPGEEILILNGQLIGDRTHGVSYLKADIETLLGRRVAGYLNQVTATHLDYYLFYDSLADSIPLDVPDYLVYGLRLAATGPDTIEGYEAAVEQFVVGAPRTRWVYRVRFRRVSSASAQGSGATSSREHQSPALPARFERSKTDDAPSEARGDDGAHSR